MFGESRVTFDVVDDAAAAQHRDAVGDLHDLVHAV